MPPPIGPLTDRQRRLEAARRAVVDIELPLRQYFDAVATLWPSEITPEQFREFQSAAAMAAEAMRRGMQSVYDLIDVLDTDSPPSESTNPLIEQVIRRLRVQAQQLERRSAIRPASRQE